MRLNKLVSVFIVFIFLFILAYSFMVYAMAIKVEATITKVDTHDDSWVNTYFFTLGNESYEIVGKPMKNESAYRSPGTTVLLRVKANDPTVIVSGSNFPRITFFLIPLAILVWCVKWEKLTKHRKIEA